MLVGFENGSRTAWLRLQINRTGNDSLAWAVYGLQVQVTERLAGPFDVSDTRCWISCPLYLRFGSLPGWSYTSRFDGLKEVVQSKKLN